MNTAKENILKALTQNHKDKGELFYDFRLGLEQETAEERTVNSLIFAFNAWSGTQWNINDSLRDIIGDATKIQKNVRECKDTNTKVLWAQSQLTDYVSKSKSLICLHPLNTLFDYSFYFKSFSALFCIGLTYP